MGSLPSKSKSVKKQFSPKRNAEVDSDGFPIDGSIKSVSMASFFEETNSEGFPRRGSIKSVNMMPHSSRQGPKRMQEKPEMQYLESLVKDQEKEIQELRSENQQLRSKIEELEKSINKFSLQLAVASKTPNQLPPNEHDGRNLPRIGDRVVSMWGSSKWQYFTATIEAFDKNTLKYEIEWDDHDPTGRIVDYYNLAVDKIPDEDQVGVGSKVLFHQAEYKSSQVHGVTRSGGLRWHQGEIEQIYDGPDGKKRYDGKHTKGREDGKWVDYKGYSEKFISYTIEDFRMPPNVFDILSSVNTGSNESAESGAEETDVFVSYAKINCPSAISAQEINRSNLPPSYEESVLDSMCDPRDIVKSLKSMGVRVYTKEDDSDDSLIEIVSAMKKAKVFIACLSDEYASNDRCRMEFQYAKKTLKLPVIPVVVGAGSFQWQLTVVGLLIAGELYINFKNREVEKQKMTELARAVKNFIPDLDITGAQFPATGDALLPLHNDPNVSVTGNPVKTGAADYFFSYCWANSKEAFDNQQMASFVGNEWSDPRLIVRRLASAATNLEYWLDIERLQSASESLGMFGQIATAMNECKFVVACVSTEYANSDNSRMEFQFATKSLRKPVIAAIVGDGNAAWKETTVGKLADEGITSVSFENLNNSSEFEEKINEVVKEMKLHVTDDGSATKHTFPAPVPGDHVVCLHQKWAYFMATVKSFDPENLQYTVNWDDGDPSGRVQSYQDLASDVVPTDKIGVGSIVIFPQGSYGGTDGNNTGGYRYHQGKITQVYSDDQGVTRFDGEHTKDVNDEKWTTYKGYAKKFTNLTKEELRVSPNAMDALMACKQAFEIRAD